MFSGRDSTAAKQSGIIQHQPMPHSRNPGLALAVAVFVGACPADKQVSLSSTDGNRSLTYSCGRIERQARSKEDLKILLENLGPALKYLKASGDTAGLLTLAGAHQNHDWERLEV